MGKCENVELQIKMIINIESNGIMFIFRNVSFDFINDLDRDSCERIFNNEWYMYGSYDRVVIEGDEFIVLIITKKKIDLVRANNKI